MLKTLLIILITGISSTVFAGGIYQQPTDFIKQAFSNDPPKAKVIWLDKALKKHISDILDHPYKALRVRYWQKEINAVLRTVWILEETGKEKLITAGFVIVNGHIEQVKILVFRESRGWEVRHDFFTDQFRQARLIDKNQLDKTIDNISGATLSVRAIRKLAQIALLLNQHINQKPSTLN